MQEAKRLEKIVQDQHQEFPPNLNQSADPSRRPDKPQRLKRPRSRLPKSESPLRFHLEQGALETYSDGLLAWVADGCQREGWNQLLERGSEAGAPLWLRPDRLGLDSLSHRVLCLGLAHSICAYGGLQGGPFKATDGLECGDVLNRLGLVPPNGMYELAKCLAADAPLRQKGLVHVSESWSRRRERTPGDALNVGQFLKAQISLNLLALEQLLDTGSMDQTPQRPTLDDLALPQDLKAMVVRFLESPPPETSLTIFIKGPEHFGRRTLARVMADHLGLPLKRIQPFEGAQPGCSILVDLHRNFDLDDWRLLQEHKGAIFLRQVDRELDFDVEELADLILDLSELNVATMAVFCVKRLKAAGPLFATCDPIETARRGIAPGRLVETIRRLKQEAQWRDHTPETIKARFESALARTPGGKEISRMTENTHPGLDLQHLFLPPAVKDRFQRVIRAVRGRKTMIQAWGLPPSLVGRSQGILLFHGPSGTGKSMAAEVLAKELGMSLYRIQASELESAYVGESEARLHRFFENAKARPAVLLLDEADSVLADRTKAEGSTRRYQVSLVNAWLRELDQFEGVLVFTTNHAAGLDPALERRIQFRIEFPMPDADIREQIWANFFEQTAIPGRETLDLREISVRFPLSGGLIRNAFLDVCQRASEVGSITQDLLYSACEEEHQAALPRPGHSMKKIQGFASGL